MLLSNSIYWSLWYFLQLQFCCCILFVSLHRPKSQINHFMQWLLWTFAGIDKLIKEGVYASAYPLHEVNLFSFVLCFVIHRYVRITYILRNDYHHCFHYVVGLWHMDLMSQIAVIIIIIIIIIMVLFVLQHKITKTGLHIRVTSATQNSTYNRTQSKHNRTYARIEQLLAYFKLYV